MRLLSTLLSALLVVSLASPANAQERWPRWYVGVAAGVNFVEDVDLSGALNGDLDVDPATAFYGSIGYMPFFEQPFFDRLRFEIEAGLRHADLDSFTNGGVTTGASEDIRIVSYMANMIYDFDTDSQWTPYLGGGIGGADVTLSDNSGLGNVTDKDTVFAYQFLAGVTYAPSSIPLTEWGIGYRYFTANSPSYRTVGTNLRLDDITTHGIEANARFRF